MQLIKKIKLKKEQTICMQENYQKAIHQKTNNGQLWVVNYECSFFFIFFITFPKFL